MSSTGTTLNPAANTLTDQTDTDIAPRSTATNHRWEGRLFGGLVLAAFALYGVGSAIVDQPVGIALVALNSLAVTTVGLLGQRVLRSDRSTIAAGYLATRAAEAILLLGGILLAANRTGSDAANTGYLLGMFVLGVGSVPFWLALGQLGRVPNWMAKWGAFGYIVLAIGTALELASGQGLAVIFAVPGGLFELTVGALLLIRGFASVRATTKVGID